MDSPPNISQSSQLPSKMGEKKNIVGAGCLILFALPFLLVGVLITYFFSIRPLAETWQSRNWEQVPAEIISSEVIESRSDGSTNYRPEIVYEYQWEGKTFQSDRFRFTRSSDSSSGPAQKIVEQHPEGSQTKVWVNPRNPERAVIDRSFRSSYLWVGAFTSIFALVGLGIIVLAIYSLRKTQTRLAPKAKNRAHGETGPVTSEAIPTPPEPGADNRVILTPEDGRWTKVLGLLFFVIIWNGVISIFLVQIFTGGDEGCSLNLPLALFLIPFVFIGVASLGALVYYFLAAFNPVAILWIKPSDTRPGTTFTLGWDLTKATGRLQNFTITLQGREMATYQQGTNTYTDEHIFHEQPLTNLQDRLTIASGKIFVTLPPEAIHSFEGENNRIIWSFSVHGDISRWPDLHEKFPFVLLPQKQNG